MKNAHLRFGTMSFHKPVGNSMSHFSLRMDRFIGERVPNDDAKAHLLSVVGGDAQIAAASAIISEGYTFTVEGPELPPMHVSLGKDAHCYRASIQLSTSKRPLRHLVAVSEEFTAIANLEMTGRTLLAESSADFVCTSLAQIFGLPMLPQWAEWFHNKLTDNLAISPLYGLGLQPVLVTGTKTEFLRWLSEGIQRGQIQLPQKNGPAVWPKMDLEAILLPAADASIENEQATT
jgi:hypothetical protein